MEEDQKKSSAIVIATVVAASLSPLLMLSEQRRDCYQTYEDCRKDWPALDCHTGPDTSCPVVGKPYFPSRYYRRTSSGIGRSIGTTFRGGFGSMAHSFHMGLG
ncbi:MAG: hypothetical protein ACJ763_10110 [Bdellovibrionia bacterium]